MADPRVRETFYRRRGKRWLDLVLVVPGLLLATPLILAVAAGVLITSGPPILFRQRRPGWRERPFTMVKFRTMAPPPADVELSDAQRLTRWGQLLRRTSLDELPALWNVVRGDMSLVGPRPLLPQYLDRYSPHQRRRHEVKPGITGWAQIHGRNELEWDERLERDVWYVDHLSLRLDLAILLRTVAIVLRGRGVSAPGHATMPEFRGEKR